MQEAYWNGLFDTRWEDAPLGREAIRLVLWLRERGYGDRSHRAYAHAVVHLGRVLHEAQRRTTCWRSAASAGPFSELRRGTTWCVVQLLWPSRDPLSASPRTKAPTKNMSCSSRPTRSSRSSTGSCEEKTPLACGGKSRLPDENIRACSTDPCCRFPSCTPCTGAPSPSSRSTSVGR